MKNRLLFLVLLITVVVVIGGCSGKGDPTDEPEDLTPDPPPLVEVGEGQVAVYDKPSINSAVVSAVHEDSLKIMYEGMDEYVYEFIDGELVLWEEIILDDGLMGYYIGEYRMAPRYSDYRNTMTLRLETGGELVFNELTDGQWYLIYDDIARYGYFTLEVWVDPKIQYKLLVDSRTGKQDKTSYYFSHSPYDDRILASDTMGAYYEQRDNKIQILNFKNNELTVEWETESWDFGIGGIEWTDKDNFRFVRFLALDNSWERVDRQYKEINEKLTYKNGEWNLTNIDTPSSSENIQIYDSIGSKTQVIGSIDVTELAGHITFTDTYQLIDGELALWFEIDIANGDKAYAYRGLRDLEQPYYDNNYGVEFHLIMENGEYLTIKDHLSNAHDYYLRDNLGEIGYYCLYQTYDGEGHTGRFINSRTGESFTGAGFPILSKTNERFIIANADLEAGYSWNGIEIFKVNENDVTLEYKEGFNTWGPTNVMWVDNEHIKFTKIHLQPEDWTWTETAAELRLMDGKWLIRDLD